MARRRDPLAISICLGEFMTGVMRIVLLMGRDFTPHWKWLPFEFRKRKEAQPYVPLLEGLVSTLTLSARREPRSPPLLNDKLELESRNPQR